MSRTKQLAIFIILVLTLICAADLANAKGSSHPPPDEISNPYKPCLLMITTTTYINVNMISYVSRDAETIHVYYGRNSTGVRYSNLVLAQEAFPKLIEQIRNCK